MSDLRHHHEHDDAAGRLDDAPAEDVLDAVLRGEPRQTPDLTRAIMGRLGYMKAHPRAARRHRFMRAVRRSGLVLTALMAVGMGLHLHNGSENARRPVDRTVPGAISNDLQRHQQRFDRFIHTIRQLPLAAPAERQAAPASLPADGDAVPGIAPFEWV